MAKNEQKTEAATAGKPAAAAAAMADASTGELTLQQRNELAAQEEDLDFSADAGAGLEGTSKDDYAIPMLIMLQGLSPQVVDGKEGCRPGLIFNTITEQATEDVVVIPCAYSRRFIEWAPREKGGGFRGEHTPLAVEGGELGAEEYIDAKGVKRLGIMRDVVDKEGNKVKQRNQLKDTRSFYVLIVRDDGTFAPAMIPFASTQIKKAKRWLSLINDAKERTAAGALFTPPMFSRMYHLFSVKESNEQGAWQGWSIGMMGKVKSRELYEAAKAFNKQVAAGEVEVRHDDLRDVDAEQTQEGDKSF